MENYFSKRKIISILLITTLLCTSFFSSLGSKAFAASGILTFSGVNETNSGEVLHDGVGFNNGDLVATDISGIQLDIFNVNKGSLGVQTGSFTYRQDINPLVAGDQSVVAPIDVTSGTYNVIKAPDIIVIKSNDGIAFHFKSIFVVDSEGEPQIKFEGFLDGVSTGAVILDINQTDFIETFTPANGLTASVFQNVDEVRISNQYQGDMTWGNGIGFNNIEIGDPVTSVAEATTADVANNSLNVNMGSVIAGNSVTLTALGDRQAATGVVSGDERYIPTSWISTEAGKSGNFSSSGGSYTSTYSTTTAGNYTVTATLTKQIWNGSVWVASATTDTKTTSVTVSIGSGVIIFSNATNISGNTTTVTDGQGGSTDLAGINVRISAIDASGNIPNAFFMNYYGAENGIPVSIIIPENYYTLDALYGISIKSSPTVKFSMSSLKFYDFAYHNGATYYIQAYRDKLTIGVPVSFNGNLDDNYVNIDLSSKTSFYNIDEVRIYRTGENYFGINNIAIGAPVAIPSYTLNYTAESNGTVTGNAAQTVESYASGTTVTAVADAGYHFVKWSDGVNNAIRTDSNVQANLDVTASFAVNTYTLKYTAGSTGTITGSAVQTVESNASGSSVTAVANPGYTFVKWSDDVLTAERTDSNVLANVNVTAIFAVNTYTLNYVAGSNGTITGSVAQTVNGFTSGTAVTAVADQGYHFVKWSDNVLTATRIDQNVLANVNVTAIFVTDMYSGVITFSSNNNISGSTVTDGQGGSIDIAGINVRISPINANGNIINEEILYYYGSEYGMPPIVVAENFYGMVYGISIKSSPAVKFSMSSLKFWEGDYFNGGTYYIQAYRDSKTIGAPVSFIGNKDNNHVNIDLNSITSFDNIDEVRIYSTGNTLNNWFGINNIAIGGPIVATHKLNYVAGSNGTLTGNAAQTVNSGASGTAVTAVADAGYHFVKWSDNITTATRTDSNVLANVNVTASFAVNTYTLSYNAGSNGTLTGSAAQTVNSGANGTAVTAVADAGYHFVKWSDNVTTATRTDSNVLANVSVTASFAVNTYTLNYNAGSNGTLTGSAAQTVNNGANGTVVTAVPDAGYHFVKWSDDVFTAERTDSNVLANVYVTASFAINTYTLNYAAGSNGTLTGNAAQTVNSGASGTAVTAVADAGYHFVKWNDNVTTATRTDSNVLANVSVTASFAVNTYTLNYAAGSNGTLTGSAAQTVNSGASGTAVTAVADAGYHFVKWSDNVLTATRTDSNVLANMSVTASFAINTYTLSYNGGYNGTLTGNIAQTVNSGASGTAVTAVADAGYHFVKWSDGVLTAERTDSNVLANVSVTANFAVNTYTIDFNSNGGLAVDSQQVTYTALATEPTPSIKSGYTFAGWYVNNNLTTQFNFTATAITSDTTLFAKWTMNPPSAPVIQLTAGNSTVVISWSSVPNADGYQLYQSTTAGAYGAPITTLSSSITNYQAVGLTNGTPYYFVVKATNAGGDSVPSNEMSATPTAPSSGEGIIVPVQPSTPTTITNTTDTATTAVEVLVNGKGEDAGTATTIQVNSQSVTTIAVDQEKLAIRLELEGQGTVITIPVNNNSDVIIGKLNGQMIKNMEQKQAVLELKTENATYTLPSPLINIDSISKQFGETIVLQDIEVRILIAKPTLEMLKIVENTAVTLDYSIVIPPIEFSVQAIYGNTTIDVSKFNAYVERTIAIPEGIDLNKITTGVVVDTDGTVRHVPTKLVVIDGKYFANVNSLTNSTYTIVWHPLEFKDVAQHWAKDAVNDMGSRMVINGINNDQFNPNQDITRAEFAAIMVRGLGLKLENNVTSFEDVTVADWYSSAIQTLYSYKLINGFEDGSFRPMDKITREQAMVIIAKAMTITELKGKLVAQTADDILHPYTDATDASRWAYSSIADVLEAGIVSGRSNTQLAPKAYITRAEVAAIVQRLLQKSDLI